MIFNSVTFLLYLPVVVILYWLLPQKTRLWMLAVMSLLFYAFWKPQYTLLLLFAAVLDYYIAIAIHRQQDKRRRRRLLIISLVLNLGILFYFKYLVFFTENLGDVLSVLGMQLQLPHLEILLPVGISFYTFETISYTVDVYRRHLEPERNFISYLNFLVYFPHLIAGPVLRASHILPQYKKRLPFRWQFINDGFSMLVYGLFLKVVLADNIAPIADHGFAMPTNAVSALDVWTLAFLFGFQIYFDFAAYSYIAIGCARMMGIHFHDNFNFPYMAVSPKAFWKRWHISLSTWIRDYLYLPLAGKKVELQKPQAISEVQHETNAKGYLALLATWAIMGFWHGANWTFIVWGVYHALLVAGYRVLGHNKAGGSRIKKITGWCISLPLLMLGWIPFRSENVTVMAAYFKKLCIPQQYLWLGLRENNYLIAAVLLLLVIAAYLFHTYIKPYLSGTIWGYWLKYVALSAAVALVIVFLRPVSQFIYFQF